jgi:hypothetical protein
MAASICVFHYTLLTRLLRRIQTYAVVQPFDVRVSVTEWCFWFLHVSTTQDPSAA